MEELAFNRRWTFSTETSEDLERRKLFSEEMRNSFSSHFRKAHSVRHGSELGLVGQVSFLSYNLDTDQYVFLL